MVVIRGKQEKLASANLSFKKKKELLREFLATPKNQQEGRWAKSRRQTAAKVGILAGRGILPSSLRFMINSIIPFMSLLFPLKRSVLGFADKTNRSALNISIT